MSSNKDAKLEYETGVTPYPMQALADAGDHINFTSNALLFSDSQGNSPDVKPDGVINGGTGKPAVSGADDLVDVSKVLCNLAGVETSVNAATGLTCVRGATTNTHRINSITVTSAGAIAVVSGTASTAFSEDRGAAGGPAYIPVGSIELFQVRFTSITAAPVTTDDIFDVIGSHRETADFPSFEIDFDNAEINFDVALPTIHTGDTVKKVHAQYADPIFIELKKANAFVPAANTHSVNSEQTYTGTDASTSKSLSASSFTATLKDGLTDDILKNEDDVIFVRYTQNKFKTPHSLTQGLLGVAIANEASDQPKATFTLSASRPTVRRAS